MPLEIILVAVVILPGMLFWPYWVSVHMLTEMGRNDPPSELAGLFSVSCCLQFLLALLFGIPMAAWPLVLVLGPAGFGGWVIYGLRRLREADRIRALRQVRPLPKLQCWMQDVLGAVFFFAGAMAVASRFDHDVSVALAVYLICACSIGFCAALDVLRRVNPPFNAIQRFVVIYGCLLYFCISLIVFGFIAWCAWRRALLNFALERWAKRADPAGAGDAPSM